MSIIIFVHIRLRCWRTNFWRQNLQFSLKMTLDSRSKTDPKQMFRNNFHRKFLYHYFSNTAVTVCRPHIHSRTYVYMKGIFAFKLWWFDYCLPMVNSLPMINKFPSKKTHMHCHTRKWNWSEQFLVYHTVSIVIKTRRINKVYVLVSQLTT